MSAAGPSSEECSLSSSPPGYTLTRTVGRGASSVVWRATQHSTGRPVALKILDAEFDDAARRFERERAALATLAVHPGIVTVYDAGVHEGRPWLAMELCRRGSLGAHIAAQGPLEPAAALAVLVRLADALATAHDAGVLHCDIKPANIMLTDHGEPALGDFGIARLALGNTTTTTGFTLDHVAPELLDDEQPSTRSDIYSLGTTMWELLAGHPPFRRGPDVAVGSVIKRIATQPLPELPAGVPASVLELLRAMTAKDPAERTATMAAVADEARTLARAMDLPLVTDLALPPLPPLDPGTVAADVADTGVAPVEDGPGSDTDEAHPAVVHGDADAASGETVLRHRPVVAPPEPAAAPEGRPYRRRVLVASAITLVIAVASAVTVAHQAGAQGQPQVDVVAESSSATPPPTTSLPPTTESPAPTTVEPTPEPTPTATRRRTARTPARRTARRAAPAPAPAAEVTPEEVVDDAGGESSDDDDANLVDPGNVAIQRAGVPDDSDSDASDTDRVTDDDQDLGVQQIPIFTITPDEDSGDDDN